ncbi:MAG: hypothetical protein EPN43_05965 [Jatrophihabitans sp.]|nr:MAG: hypothetical protein EPN43_05965 [Jatrophihabitans sp.]
MTDQAAARGAMPRDVRARERMRDAQAAEARAVSAICAAQNALARVVEKRNQVVARADATVREAERSLVNKWAELVAVSGLEHAARLLGTTPAKLRRETARPAAKAGDRV